jgi:hypothetical protein
MSRTGSEATTFRQVKIICGILERLRKPKKIKAVDVTDVIRTQDLSSSQYTIKVFLTTKENQEN